MVLEAAELGEVFVGTRYDGGGFHRAHFGSGVHGGVEGGLGGRHVSGEEYGDQPAADFFPADTVPCGKEDAK